MASRGTPYAVAVLCGVLILLLGCGDDEVTNPPPPTGSIEVSLTMTGSVPDADGCLVAINNGAGDLLLSGQSLSFSGLAASTYTVTITDVAPNCTVQGEASRTVEVSANETTQVPFAVDCPAFGSLEISTGTAGSGAPDPDGYTVTLDGDFSRHIGVEDVTAFSELAAGQHEVELTGVADNCTALDNPRVVTVTESEATSIDFGVACPPFYDYIAFERGSRDGNGLFVMRPDGSELLRLTADTLTHRIYPAWAPDATRISLTSDRDLWVLDTEGGTVTRLTKNAEVQLASWSPDGMRIVYDSFAGEAQGDSWGDIYMMNADGTNPVNLTPGPARGWDPAWSPDGNRIAFARCEDLDCDVTNIWVMGSDGSNPQQLTDLPPRYHAFEPAWSPDGMRIAFSAPYEQADRIIWVMDADGSNQTRLTEDVLFSHAWRPTWSPDGTRIAYRISLPEDGLCYQIYVIQADGSNPTNITNHESCNTQPAWSPGP